VAKPIDDLVVIQVAIPKISSLLRSMSEYFHASMYSSLLSFVPYQLAFSRH
jgi:hypothetical protein